ncbi:hypothetical protein SAMN03159358_4531 [Paenibacillus sp. NFR01]|nr:hypothetical protein [Paenibacillus sp. NFR01]SEU26660.1 hypothetical protein SAMN03159358_4531 [Paenibacillus sp. NFR01]
MEGEKPAAAYFTLELISAAHERQRRGRYLAVYRFGIRYEQGEALEAEGLADKVCEALAEEVNGSSEFRMLKLLWEAGTAEKGPLLTAEFMVPLLLELQTEDEIRMAKLLEEERLG